MIGKCKSCGYQAGIFCLSDGLCDTCSGAGRGAVDSHAQKEQTQCHSSKSGIELMERTNIEHVTIQKITRQPFFIGMLASSGIFASPLLYHQLPTPRIGLLWYPVILLLLSLLLAFILRRASTRNVANNGQTSEKCLIFSAYISGGLFVAWLSALGAEMLGGNGWHGNILYINIATGVLGLFASIWAAFALRLIAIGKDPVARSLFILIGAIGIPSLWFAMYNSTDGYVIPFWDIFRSIGIARNTEYAIYFLLESLYWQVAWPILMLLAVVTTTSSPSIQSCKPQGDADKHKSIKQAGNYLDNPVLATTYAAENGLTLKDVDGLIGEGKIKAYEHKSRLYVDSADINNLA